MLRICTYLCMCLLSACITEVLDQQSLQTCPQKCKCTPEGPELAPAVKVQCVDRNLKSVPNKTFDEPVSLLDVSFNDLYTLEDNTFFQYESVNHIYLKDCKLEYISEKTFQRLANLIVVDLSNNYLTSIPPDLFNDNHRLQTLKLRSNDLSTYQRNTTLLNGPISLSSLDLNSCQLSILSSVTFSALPNLEIIDMSQNNLDSLNFDTLSAHQNLQDVNLESNPFRCGQVFEILLNAMQSNLSLVHYRKITCNYKDHKWEIWAPDPQSPLYRRMTTPSITPYEADTNDSTTLRTSTILSHKSDTNASTTLQPSKTLSLEPDTNVSTTLKSSVTPSNKSDISENTTVNPTNQSQNKLNFIIAIPIIIIAILIALIIFFAFRCYKKLKHGNTLPQIILQNGDDEEL